MVGPGSFLPEVVVAVNSLACELPSRLGVPFSRVFVPDSRARRQRAGHRGGDLGCHDLAFELAAGVPARGPASIPQPVYESRFVANKLEMRRHERRALRQRVVCEHVKWRCSSAYRTLRGRPLHGETVSLRSVFKTHDRPCLPSPGLADGLHAMVTVLKDELAAPKGDDHRRWLPPFFDLLVHSVHAIIPIFFANRAQHRIARRPREAVQLVERQSDGSCPPTELLRELLGQGWIVTPRARKESSHP